MHVLQPGHAAHQFVLDVKRQAGADAVRVVLIGGQTFGLQKNLVTVLVGKAVDLVFHAGAVARPNPFNLAGEHGAAVKATADDVVGAFVGVGDPARHLLRVHVQPTHETEDRHGGAHAAGHAVAGLCLAFAEVNAAAIQPGWRAGFQAALRQLQFLKPCTQRNRRWVPCPARRVVA